MSQIFEALRRTREPPRHGAGSKRTAQADAVLATMGFASERQRTPRRLAPVILFVLVCALAWLAWQWYARDDPPMADIEPPRSLPTAAPAAPPPVASGDSTVRDPQQPRPVENVEAAAASSEPLSRRHETPKVSTSQRALEARRSPDPFQLALYYHRSGDFENALVHYRAVLRDNELDARAHNNLGLLYREKGLLEDAVRQLQQALVIDSRYSTARNNLGVAWLGLGRLEDAASEFERVLAADPEHVDALVNLALVQKSSGRPGVAIETLVRAIGVDGSSAPAHYNLAVLYDQSGESGRADDHYRAFLQHTGSEHGARAAEVRARLAKLPNGHTRH